METKKQNDLPAEHKWNSMSFKERESFLIIQGLHSPYIKRTVPKKFNDLDLGLKKALKTYKIPNKNNTEKRKLRTMVFIGTRGVGKTYSGEYLKNNKVKLIPAKKDEKRKSLDINITNINKFLNTLTDTEFIYLHKTLGLSFSMRAIISDYKISAERFCEEMGINKKLFKVYMSGSRNFDLKDISKLNALAVKLYMENAEKNAEESVPVKTPIRTSNSKTK